MEGWEKIKGIYAMAGLGKTPAMARISTGEIFINPEVFYVLDPDERYFVLLHEAGHIINGNNDELQADEWASAQYLNSGGSLEAAVSAFDGYGIEDRQAAQLQRVLQHDAYENGNMEALEALFSTQNFNGQETQTGGFWDGITPAKENADFAGWIMAAVAGASALFGGLFGGSQQKKQLAANEKMAREQAASQLALAEKQLESQYLQASYKAFEMKNTIKILVLVFVFAIIGYIAYTILKSEK